MSNTAETETQAGPKPGSEEYNQAMASKGRGETDQVADDDNKGSELPIPAMPDGGHEKFYNKETGAYDWKSHAVEADYNLNGRKKPDQQQQDDGQHQQAQPAQGNEQAAYDRLMADLTAGDEVSDDTRRAFVDLVGETMADRVIEDATSNIQAAQQEAFDHVGGQDKMGELLKWASENLSQADRDFYNKGLASPAFRDALDGLIAKRAKANPTANEGQLQSGNSHPGGDVVGYRSKAQRTADMQDPRYKKDPSFRRMVAAKVAVSKYEDDAGEVWH